MKKEVLKSIFSVTEIKDERLYKVVCAIHNGTDVYGNDIQGRLNFNQPWRIGISRTLLHNLCKKELGVSAKIMRYKILFYKACQKLRVKGLSIDTVKRICRYDSMSNFNSFFKRFSGMTPLQFRNKVEKKVA